MTFKTNISSTFEILVPPTGPEVKLAKKFHGEIARTAEGEVDVVAEMSKHPNFLWMRVKAIEADVPNDNGDYFSREEIMKSYRSFEGVPVFTNHENQKVENAKGKVVKAEWNDAENAVYCTMFVDREAFPALCRSIEEGIVTDVSMGTQVDYSTCSLCENKAYTADSYCDHVRTMKGRSVNGKKVFEKNYGLKFIELSVVTDGACDVCIIEQILDPAEYAQGAQAIMRAAQTVEDIVKTGGFSKDAGQQEIQELNEAMSLIEKVTRAMLDQRAYVDLEFASKVMEVLADLQHVTDELVDQGYASIGNPGQQPGQEMQVPPMPENAEMSKGPAGEGQKPSITGPASAGVGSVTEPATAAAADPKAILSTKIATVKDISEKLAKFYEEKRLSGGDEVSKEAKFQETISKLAKIWENPSVRNYRTEVSDGDFKIVIGGQDIWGMRGGQKIAQLKLADLDADVKEAIAVDHLKVANVLLDELKRKYAGVKVAEKAPTDTAEQQTETMEAQLESQKLPWHPREHEVRESITEDQLKKKRDGSYDVHARRDENRQEITEKQLHKGDYPGFDNFKPQDKPRTETMEPQLRDNGIKGNITPADVDSYAAGVKDQKQQIHEGQLEDWRSADKGHNPTDYITEKQLKEDIGEPWGRRIASKEDAKKALAAGMKAIVRTASATGATPDEIIEAVGSIADNPKILVACIEKIDSMAKDQKARESRGDLLRRASFHGKLVVASKQDVTEFLLGSVTDAGMGGEVGMYALETLASQKDAFNKIAKAIEAGIEEAPKQATSSAKDFMKQALLEDEDKTQSINVNIPASEIKASPEDKEAFANAAYEAATKLAAAKGLTATGRVHVANLADGSIDVEMTGVPAKAEEKKEEKSAAAEVEQRKEARKKLVEAQAPGGAGAPGMGGGGAGGGMAGMGGGGTTMPQMPPGDPSAQPPVGALGETPPPGDGMEEEEGGEAMPPGSLCPACGSDDVDVRKGEFNCNNCGGTGHITVRVDMDNWPGTIEEKSPDKGDGEMPGMPGEGGEEIGGMGGEGEGMEVPPVGVAASFKVTPEMVKVAHNKPIGSFCPRCGSSKVELSTKMGNGDGKCCSCASSYKVESYIDQSNKGELWARIEWLDGKPTRKAAKTGLAAKKASLEKALKDSGMTGKFASADFNGKAAIIAKLHNEKLLG